MNTAGTVVLIIFLLLLAAGIGWVVFSRLRAQRLGLPPPAWSSFLPFGKSRNAGYGVQPAPGGVVGWINDRVRMFRNRNSRTAAGAYEGAAGGSAGLPRGRSGFGPLDPDEAWDSRVGTEADAYGPGGYYEEQELGLHPHAGGGGGYDSGNTGYAGGSGGNNLGVGGSSYDMNLAATPGVTGGPSGFPGTDDEEEERGRRGRPWSRGPGGGGSGALHPGAAGGHNPFDDDAEPSNISMRGVSPRPIDTSVGGPSAAGAKAGAAKADSPTERKSIFREEV